MFENTAMDTSYEVWNNTHRLIAKVETLRKQIYNYFRALEKDLCDKSYPYLHSRDQSKVKNRLAREIDLLSALAELEDFSTILRPTVRPVPAEEPSELEQFFLNFQGF